MNEQVKNELQSLRNMINGFNLDGYSVHHVPNPDNRIKKREYVFCEPSNNGLSHGITGRLNYENMNHFIFGFGKAMRMNFEALAARHSMPRAVNLHKVNN